jgi:hypothetical protein
MLAPWAQAALFWHGFDPHSSKSTSQLSPEYPLEQTQAYASMFSAQAPPFAQGLDVHSSKSMHDRPPVIEVYPGMQLHR